MKDSRVATIVTARGGSKSIHKKNIITINKKPLLFYPVMAAINSDSEYVFVDTDCDQIKNVARYLGAEIIHRPSDLSGDTIDHGVVIRAACKSILDIHEAIEIFVILLGNTVMVDHKLINRAIALLNSNPLASGVCSVWKAADDHPLRSMEIAKDGYLYSHPSVIQQSGMTTDRNSYYPAYYYDQGVWVFRTKNLESYSGPATWSWLGDRVIPIIREWVTGRDINSAFDVNFHILWNELAQTPESFPVYVPPDLI